MSGDSLEARFASTMGRLLGPDFPKHIALAVSGGGDSMAMLALAHGWARVMGVRLWVVTVDHGLRAESADEAAMVAAECAALGHPHATLRWHWDGQGNVQDAARQARLALIDRWRGGIEHVLFAHTQDDVAETFLMRLARGSGVEGLSAIAERRSVRSRLDLCDGLQSGEVVWTDGATCTPPSTQAGPIQATRFYIIRPLLEVSRSELRHYADSLHIPYADDPSNADARFDRVKARQILGHLSPLGVTARNLAATAKRLRRARVALGARARGVARSVVRMVQANGVPTGDVLLDRDGLSRVERDTQLRVLASALQWVSSDPYRPRSGALEDLLERVLSGGAGTLHGCEVRAETSQIRVFREYEALKSAEQTVAGETRFDRRWILSGGTISGATIRALGPEGWAQIPEKPQDAPPFRAARSLPAVFDGEYLVACRPLDFGPVHQIALWSGDSAFDAFLESD